MSSEKQQYYPSEKPSGLSQNIAWNIHKVSNIAHVFVIIFGHLILRMIFTKHIAYQ